MGSQITIPTKQPFFFFFFLAGLSSCVILPLFEHWGTIKSLPFLPCSSYHNSPFTLSCHFKTLRILHFSTSSATRYDFHSPLIFSFLSLQIWPLLYTKNKNKKPYIFSSKYVCMYSFMIFLFVYFHQWCQNMRYQICTQMVVRTVASGIFPLYHLWLFHRASKGFPMPTI